MLIQNSNGLYAVQGGEIPQYSYKVAFKVNTIYLNVDKTSYANGRDILVDLVAATNEYKSVNTVKIHAYDSNTIISQNILTREEVNNLAYQYGWDGNKNSVAITTRGDATYIVFDSSTGVRVDCNVTTYIYGYENGRFVGKKSINQTAATNSTDNSPEPSQSNVSTDKTSADPSTTASSDETLSSTTTEAGGGSGTSAPMETDPSNSSSSTDAPTTVTDPPTPEDGNDGQEVSSPIETDNVSEEKEQAS